ncbi:hypothetical protein BIW11_13927 [Tropilaelaps mercedesae]|uniref:Uncharacterized protein n=1 Tax=Tropilaelaps mercedesae TaxID=418985 RepID=A0A1V9X056_9ACAR|nr:hypothetical protein BIW11_13927 [Tropilaelaps mercedesae]
MFVYPSNFCPILHSQQRTNDLYKWVTVEVKMNILKYLTRNYPSWDCLNQHHQFLPRYSSKLGGDSPIGWATSFEREQKPFTCITRLEHIPSVDIVRVMMCLRRWLDWAWSA